MMNVRFIMSAAVLLYPNVVCAQLTNEDFPGTICGIPIGSTPEVVISLCADGEYDGVDRYVCHRLHDALNFEADVIVSFSISGTVDSVSIISARLTDAGELIPFYRDLFRQYVSEFGVPLYDEETNNLFWTFGVYGRVNLGVELQDLTHGNLHMDFIWRRN